MGTFVLKYGALAPTVNEDLARDQLRLGHKYENKLIEIEIKRRDALRALEMSYGDIQRLNIEAAEAAEAYKKARAAMKAQRGKVRSKKSASPELLEASKEAKEKAKATREAFQAARASLRENRPSLKIVQDEIEEAADKASKQASAESGVYWGTKQLAEQAMQARKSMKYAGDGKPPPGALWDGIKPHNPKFLKWNGGGSLGVQLQKGITEAELVNDTQLRIGAMTPRKEWSVDKERRCCPIKPEGRRRSRYRTLVMRVTSDEKGKPIFAEWPFQMHRDLPPNSRIKKAAVHVRKRGPKQIWYVTITVETSAPVEITNARGAVAINVGWRVVDRIGSDPASAEEKELRVCTFWDEDGHHGELRLSASDIEAIRRSERLASTRSTSFDRMKVSTLEWLERITAPGWLIEEVQTLPSWKSPGRFVKLEQKWRENRFDGDEQMLGELQEWLKHDRHLWIYQSEQRQQGLDRRRDIYRKFACWLARKYETLCLVKFDKRKTARLPKDEEVEADNKFARSNRQLAAVSTLEQCFRQAFLSRGGQVRKVDPSGATQTCAVTNTPEPFDAAPQIEHACRCGCGKVWDQDFNHAQNVLRWAFEPNGGESGREVTIERDSFQPQEGRWARLKREKAEKEAREEAEREAEKEVDKKAS